MPTVRVNDIKMYYEQSGSGQPLVLIAGLGLDVCDCRKLIEALAAHHRVLAFDNRGAGRTDMPDAPYTLAQMSDDTAGLMRTVEVGPADVVGISMGGRIALELALKDTGLVRSLILASTSARVSRRWPVRLLGLVSTLPMLRGRHPQPRYAHRRQREASSGYDSTARLPQVSVPTLIMHGRRDRIAPYRGAEHLREHIRGATLVPLDGGHLYPLVHSDAFAGLLDTFTAALSGP